MPRRTGLPALLLLLTGCGVGGQAAGPDSTEPDGAAPSSSDAPTNPTPPDPSEAEVTPTDQPSDQPSDQASDELGGLPSERAFSASIDPIGEQLRERMRGAGHRAGCPVAVADLRVLTVDHATFDGGTATGRIVVAASVAEDVVSVFERLHEARWPIRRLRTIDRYGGDDDASMADDNSSGYNCRNVAGTDRWSDHALGTAIDLNPVENPYVTASGVFPPRGDSFADVDRGRDADPRPGVVVAGDVVVRAFADIGWTWGGTWTTSKDYQHFSLSGR